MDICFIVTTGITLVNTFGILLVWLKYVQLAQYSINATEKLVNNIYNFRNHGKTDWNESELLAYGEQIIKVVNLFKR